MLTELSEMQIMSNLHKKMKVNERYFVSDRPLIADNRSSLLTTTYANENTKRSILPYD
jgi:hypothetical protein